ncbi:MAG TPA: hypothetical protein VJ860_17540 [Polyangia bacterium]|jgi:Antistasin family.|nr:hypothetical protein [Polyangia bacterium]
MRTWTYSIPIGIVYIALAGMVLVGCGGNRGLQSARPDGGASDAAASPGGQPGSTVSAGGAGGATWTTDTAGSAGSPGTTGSADAGGAAGEKGTGGIGGSADAGGEAGSKGTGGVVGLGGTTGLGGTKGCCGVDAGADAKVVCGPVCAIDCQYGYVMDPAGCPTCTCNSPPPCPGMKCAACPFGNVQDANGCLTCTCLPDPSVPCSQIFDGIQCGSRGNCAWLEPGYCVSPPPVARGCYDLAAINCSTEKDCSDGRTCVTRVTKPCTVGCDICGYSVDICL